MCQLPAVRLMAEETGQSLEQVGTTTARPPWHAVPMGALAGRPFEPAKRSAIHGRHRELGANVMWAGDWRRAYDYGDPQAEALAVHEAAGLIDVSTLGKLIVRGPDAGEFLDRLYPNRFSNLKPGRIRYGVIASDAGRIMDDGTICRLDDDTLLRDHHLERRRRRLRVVLVVARRLAARRAADRRHAGAVRGQPRRPARAGDHGRADRARLLGRGVHLPRRQAGRRGGRALPDPADRLRRRGGLRDPLPVGARPAPLGRAHGGRRRARDEAVRARAAAAAAPAEDAHPDRPGHRLRVHAVRRRDALDRQARQGPGLHRQVGARARRRTRTLETALVGFRLQQRPRADRGRGGAARTARARSARSRARASRRSSAA